MVSATGVEPATLLWEQRQKKSQIDKNTMGIRLGYLVMEGYIYEIYKLMFRCYQLYTRFYKLFWVLFVSIWNMMYFYSHY